MVGLYSTDFIRRRGPWWNPEHLELATADWVRWWNHRASIALLATSRRPSTRSSTIVSATPAVSPNSNRQGLHKTQGDSTLAIF